MSRVSVLSKLTFLAFVSSFAAASNAPAAMIWRMDDNAGNIVTLLDGDADGIITFGGSVGSFTVSGTARSKPDVGSSTLALLLFDPLKVTTTGAVAAPLKIQLTVTDFPLTSAWRDKIFMLGPISNGSITGSGFFDPANIEFGTGGLEIPLGTFSAPPNPTTISFDSGWVPFGYGSVPYSMTLQLDVQATGALNLDLGSVGLIQTPEIDPATGSSALSLVAGVLAMIEQRRRRAALVA